MGYSRKTPKQSMTRFHEPPLELDFHMNHIFRYFPLPTANYKCQHFYSLFKKDFFFFFFFFFILIKIRLAFSFAQYHSKQKTKKKKKKKGLRPAKIGP